MLSVFLYLFVLLCVLCHVIVHSAFVRIKLMMMMMMMINRFSRFKGIRSTRVRQMALYGPDARSIRLPEE